MEQEEQKSKWWIWILLGVVIMLILAVLFFLTIGKNSEIIKKVSTVFPVGQVVPVSDQTITGGGQITGGDNSGGTTGEEPMFRLLAKGPVAGYTTVFHDGQTFVRYVLRENGNVHEVDTKGADRQLTNTTIPRVYEAFFGNQGNTVVLRYLRHDYTTDTIVTYLGDIMPPGDGETVGSLKKSAESLPDNILAISISPDGTHLFYLIRVSDGVSGTIVTLSDSLFPKEVFRNSFSEWTPQLFDNGTILLTTKPSAQVPGYSYLYDTGSKLLKRIVREKDGLTSFGDNTGDRILFSENNKGTPSLGLYTKKGSSEEGVVNHETEIPLTALPEKCAWGTMRHSLYCGSSAEVPTGTEIPDDWYQGLITLNDTFWSINTDTPGQISFIADPAKVVRKDFDVTLPLVDNNEQYLFFVDKHDGALWSMKLPVFVPDTETSTATDTQQLTPEEQKDAAGTIQH